MAEGTDAAAGDGGDAEVAAIESETAATKQRDRRFLIGAIVLAVLIVGGGIAIASRLSTTEAANTYCSVYDDTSAEVKAFVAEANEISSAPMPSTIAASQKRVDEIRTTIDDLEALIERRRDAAPDQIRDDWDAILATMGSGQTTDEMKLSDEKRLEDAGEAVDAYAEERCGLPGDWGS